MAQLFFGWNGGRQEGFGVPQSEMSRRKALTIVAAAPAAVALVARSAVANSDEVAPLLDLWEQWRVQHERWLAALDHEVDAEERASMETPPRWKWCGGMGFFLTRECTFSADYIAMKNGDLQRVPLVGAKNTGEAYEMARVKQAEFDGEYERAKRVANRRNKVTTLKRLAKAEFSRLEDIRDQIIDTPAEGIKGIAVKLALYRFERDFIDEQIMAIVESTYETVTKVAGFDPVAQVKEW